MLIKKAKRLKANMNHKWFFAFPVVLVLVGVSMLIPIIQTQVTYSAFLYETMPMGDSTNPPIQNTTLPKTPITEVNVKMQTISPKGETKTYETHNTLTNVGLNLTQYILFGATTGNFTGLWLSTNSTAPTTAWTNCTGAVNADGLEPVWGTVTYDASVTSGVATVLIYHNFTYTGTSITIYKGCLMNDITIGAPDIPLAIANFSASAPMATSYKLNYQWNVTMYQPA